MWEIPPREWIKDWICSLKVLTTLNFENQVNSKAPYCSWLKGCFSRSSTLEKVEIVENPAIRGNMVPISECLGVASDWHEMDPEIWKDLPNNEELLLQVLNHMSWSSIKGFLPVSKVWKDLLSERSTLTWSSMLSDQVFSAHGDLEWSEVRSTFNSKQRNQTLAHPLCLLSTSKTTHLYAAVANFEIHRWCKLPPLQQLPFQRLEEFRITGAAEGMLLLERKKPNQETDLYELDRFVLNPSTMDFVNLPPVPKNEHRIHNSLRYPMIMATGNNKSVRVVAVEFCSGGPGSRRRMSRILIWQQEASADGWRCLETDAPGVSSIDSSVRVSNAMFVDGDLFLHTEYRGTGTPDYRLIKCVRHAEIFGGLDSGSIRRAVLHFFQHQGKPKRLTGIWNSRDGSEEPNHRYNRRRPRYMKLCTLDQSNGIWQQESWIEIPIQIMSKVYETNDGPGGTWRFSVKVEGDILCLYNLLEPEVFFLYNIVSQRSRVDYIKDSSNQSRDTRQIFLWSPQDC
ncbi:hypothetical protein R1sor_004034 [Riccia sorocarpa]|uniref:F-box domain-containing protein n=1 Tax=Riccia sorocarpa TaxID=122646 RepID=A0ABD3H3D0_9MARC